MAIEKIFSEWQTLLVNVRVTFNVANDFNGGKYNHDGCLKFRWNRMKANENESASFYNKDVLLGNYFIVINVGKGKKR